MFPGGFNTQHSCKKSSQLTVIAQKALMSTILVSAFVSLWVGMTVANVHLLQLAPPPSTPSPPSSPCTLFVSLLCFIPSNLASAVPLDPLLAVCVWETEGCLCRFQALIEAVVFFFCLFYFLRPLYWCVFYVSVYLTSVGVSEQSIQATDCVIWWWWKCCCFCEMGYIVQL